MAPIRTARHLPWLLLLWLAIPGVAAAAEMRADLHESDAVELDGPWAFYWDTFLSPHSEPGRPPSALTRLPQSWTGLSIDGHPLPPTGHASYRLRLDLGPRPPARLTLRVPMVYSAYRLYLDGELVAGVGTPAESPDAARPDYGERRVALVDPGRHVDLLFHVSNYSSRAAGFPKPLEIGTPTAIDSHRAVELMSASALAGGLILIGLSQLILFVIRRREWTYLFFGLTVALWGVQTVMSGQLLSLAGWHVPVSLARPLDGFTALTAGAAYLLFISSLFPRELPFRYTRWTAVPVVIYLGVTFFGPDLLRSEVVGWLLYFMVGLLTLALIAILRAWRRGQPDAGLILLGSGAIAVTAVLQIYWFNQSGVRDAVANVGVLIAMGLHSIALARRYARAFERSQRLELALRRANRQKDEFLANTSHELRTPLHAMIGLAESLPQDEPRLRHGLELIARSGHRLARLVDDILAFTRLKQGELPIQPKAILLAPLVHNVLAVCQPLIGRRPVILSADIPADMPPVRADPDRLHQVLFNLVGNAIKFTDAGEVRVSVDTRDGQAAITIRDTGLGIPPEELDRMQRPYEQGHASSLEGRGGFGLGLAISREIVVRHGSELLLDSRPGQGTQVRFALPLLPGESVEDNTNRDVRDTPLIDEAPGTDPPATPGAPRAEILVVEDDEAAATVLETQLELAGYRVRSVRSGTQALEAVERQRPDLVLLDVMMPDMSGLTVCRHLREEHDANALPVILVTARTRPEDVVEGLDAGANDYLAKPFWRREMLARVEAQLRIHENEQMRWALDERERATDPKETVDPRERLVELLNRSVTYWELQTGKGRADLAEESRLWTVTLDGSSRKTRTLDRYLSIDTLPRRPRWGVVARTARFVAERLDDEAQGSELIRLADEFQALLEPGGTSKTRRP